jgi:hypothetical protein
MPVKKQRRPADSNEVTPLDADIGASIEQFLPKKLTLEQEVSLLLRRYEKKAILKRSAKLPEAGRPFRLLTFFRSGSLSRLFAGEIRVEA